MSITACALVVQTSATPQTNHQITQAYAGYFVIALVAVVLGFVVLMLVRANPRGTSKR